MVNLIVPGGQEFHFPYFSSNFDQFFLFFLKLYLFSSLFWPSGWVSRPPGKALHGYATEYELFLEGQYLGDWSPIHNPSALLHSLTLLTAYMGRGEFIDKNAQMFANDRCIHMLLRVRSSRWLCSWSVEWLWKGLRNWIHSRSQAFFFKFVACPFFEDMSV